MAPFKILLVEDGDDDAVLVTRMLRTSWRGELEIARASLIADALKILPSPHTGCILLDLGLPDSTGLDGLARLAAAAPELPIVVLTGGQADEDAGTAALRQGAQDYLVKGRIDGPALTRAIRYATERKRAEVEMRIRDERLGALERFKSIFSEVATGQVVVSPEGRILMANRAFCGMLGYSEAELLAMARPAFTHPDDLDVGANEFARLVASEIPYYQVEKRFLRKDGSVLWALLNVAAVRSEHGGLEHVVTQIQDITAGKQAEEALEDARRALEHQSLHDSLTDLPNRGLIRHRLEAAISQANHGGVRAALLVMDLDHFKEVNDTLGHAVGDDMLRQVAQRLREAVSKDCAIARLHSDEFAVLITGAGIESATEVANRILAAFDRPFTVQGTVLDVGASIGIAAYPEHGDDADALFSRADIALTIAKRSPRSYSTYGSPDQPSQVSRHTLMAELRTAIQHDELLLQYQPIYGVRFGIEPRFETLVRWRQPQRGLIPPADFIPFAEQTGLIEELTRWVLGAALRQCRRWMDAGHCFAVGVNVSMRDLRNPELPDVIDRLVMTSGVDPSSLGLEITESVIMADPERILATLKRLRELGVHISIDDFGTGYSSLAYLHRLPVDEIKIDKSFVARITSDVSSAAIVRAAVDLAHGMHLGVVAEGVEDQPTLDLLTVLGVDAVQGFYTGKPMLADEAVAWLSRYPRPGQRPDYESRQRSAA
jgi:diguanylate cyclase (GGDEF)-like protein/PAS domain S-box-containing protein